MTPFILPTVGSQLPGEPILYATSEVGFFNVRVDPNLARADLQDDSRVDPRNSGQDSLILGSTIGPSE